MKTIIHFWSYLAHFFLDWEMFQKKCCRDNQNTHFISSNFFRNRVVCEIMWKNIVELEKPQMAVWCMHISHCIPNTTTLSEYVLLIAFPLQHLLHGCASMLRYTYVVCLVYIKIYSMQWRYFSFWFICI
jgi:hypothetical protein